MTALYAAISKIKKQGFAIPATDCNVPAIDLILHD
jgi:hypothetical protein